MGRSRAPRGPRTTAPSRKVEPRAVDPRDAKLAIDSWEDVADEVDAFHLARDKVLLEDDGGRDDDVDSEEEVMALDISDSDEDDEDEDDEDGDEAETLSGRAPPLDDDDDEEEEDEEAEEGWGASKSAYYGADEAENEEDAAAEEAEARRIQQKQLASMSAADFLFDDDDSWAAPAAAVANTNSKLASTKVVEVLPKTIDASMPAEQRLKLLSARHPEFDMLRKEFLELQETHKVLELSAKAAEAVGNNVKTNTTIRKWTVLSAYLGVLAMYFAVLTGEAARESMGAAVKEHPVMEGVLGCRRMWEQVKGLAAESASSPDSGKLVVATQQPEKKKRKRDIEVEEPSSASEEEDEPAPRTTVKKAKTSKHHDYDFTDLDALATKPKKQPPPQPPASRKPTRTTTATSATTTTADGLDEDDFGEDPVLSAIDAEEKSARRRGLRFYASQVISKSTKRAAAGRDRGGDDDVPHKERRKERELRLQREAAKRRATAGADLDDAEPDDNDRRAVQKINKADNNDPVDSDDEYYDLLAATAKQRKGEKKALHEAVRAARKEGNAVVVVQSQGKVGADGKRAIGYTIEKNKGLTPHRKKDVRNPRVKKKKAYEKAKKRLGSQKQVFRGGLKGSYGGEATGIKTNVVKSVKFAS